MWNKPAMVAFAYPYWLASSIIPRAYWPSVHLPEEMTADVLCPYFSWIVCGVAIELWEFFLYSGYKLIFSHSVCCIFTFLIMSSDAQNFNFNEVHFFYFFLLFACVLVS